jgi:hypothetical protein
MSREVRPRGIGAGRRSVLGWLVVLVLSWASLSFDVFGVIGLHSDRVNRSTSENIVFDGILRAGEPGPPSAPLGAYVRDDQRMYQRDDWFDAFERQDRREVYRPYLSQYGLQGRLWSAVHYATGASASALIAINALLVAGMIATLWIYVRRLFGDLPAALFVAVSALSPWQVAFAQSLYWVIWTWMLPTVVGFALGRAGLHDARGLTVLSVTLFLATVLKLLCGYEYVTTVLLAATVPIVYYGVADRVGLGRLFGRLVVMVIVGVLALGSAIGLHLCAQASRGVQGSDIWTLIEKRLYSRDPAATAKQACEEEFFESNNCVETYVASLQASPLKVVARYLVFDDLLPWLPRLESPNQPGQQDAFKQALREAAIDRSPDAALRALREADWATLSRPVLRLLDAVSFAVLLVLLLRKLWLLRRSRPEIVVMIAFAFAAPLSWFVLAKGHSYVHTAMNYVLWYVPFLPLAVAVLATRSDTTFRPVRSRRLAPHPAGGIGHPRG